MERIVIEVDEQLKRKMKAKLAQDGKTFKDVLTEFCRWYVAGKIEFSHWSDQCINLLERFEVEQPAAASGYYQDGKTYIEKAGG